MEQHANNLQDLIALGRKDADFDLFCRRLQMAEKFSTMPLKDLEEIYSAGFYSDFWKLAGEAQRVTKFANEELNISRKMLEQLSQEKNPIRRQSLALLLIIFNDMDSAQQCLDTDLWSAKLRENFITFANWQQLANNPLTPQMQATIARNEQTLAFLQEKYSALIKKHSQAVINEKTCPHVENYQIYFCWLQGEENLPPIVRCCYNSLKQNAGRYKIVFIDEKNFSDYVDLAPHVMKKFRAGKITRTHFSDILRFNLLERYGGLWLDATVLVTEPLENYKNLLEQNYFTQRFYKEKSYSNNFAQHITFGRWTGFIQGTTIIHNPLFVFVKELFDSYWKDFDEMIDYFLIDFSMALAYDNIPCVTKIFDAVPINNIGLYFIQNHLNDSYATFPYDKILKDTFLHKLSWKIQLDTTREDTVFKEIKRRYM